MNLEDIAKKAGVSRSTVSRVINDDPNVNALTREKVWQIIRAENFHPNPSARALVTRRTEIVGVVIPTSENIFFTDNSYFPQLLAGLNYGTRDLEYALLLWLGELTAADDNLIRRISNNRQMDGIIIASMEGHHPFFAMIPRLRYPVVMIDRPMLYEDRLSYVTVDNIAAAEMAVEHLIKLGRRRIAHITGHPNIGDAQDRLQGYKNALQRAGLPILPELIIPGHFNRNAGYDGLRQLLPHKPDAIFAAGDTIAIGILQAARDAGLTVPDDLSVIGFDDIDVASQSFPMLTTVRQPVQQKGEKAARLLIDLIEGRAIGPQHIILPTELVVRHSCGASSPLPLR
ncbi:MAG: LacI family DNA-binding transcriptional regulator [Anaerolinea sp.]|nr:LacI family DNA-binding transcriptional regulator [Anaerolinea sp.]MCC6974490.1 LacI family DNA-binding transcriptional regulator [Anaerolineae bacterium]CAG0997924.1 HTH-type transcriptional regulator DegA [Anaerolineae bacterium]